MEKDLITLNIGGTVFKTLRSTLKKFPHSKLGKLKSSSRNYINSSNEYFFDRSPELFNVILDYYRSEDIQLHIPSYICGSVLIRELEFWEIPIRNISDCCFRIYTDYQNGDDIRKNIDIHKITRVQQKQNQSFQDRAWLLLDQPRTSFGAMVMFITFMLMVLLSVMATCLVTDSSFRENVVGLQQLNGTSNITYNSTNQQQYPKKSHIEPTKQDERTIKEEQLSWKIRQFIRTKPTTAMRFLDFITNSFFALELILHFMFCPHKKRFMKDNNNKIDVFVFIFTVEFYIVIALSKELMIYESYRLFFILSSVTVMFKLLRFFRLTKVYTELQILLLAISASIKELILLFVTFGIFAIVFGNLIYYTELTEPDTFHDIFIGIWWAVVTMTTVGYGDVVPKSPAGYVTGVITSMSGLLIIAMPVAIIARNFDGYYNAHYDRILKRQTKSNINSYKVLHDVKTLPVNDIFEQNIDHKL